MGERELVDTTPLSGTLALLAAGAERTFAGRRREDVTSGRRREDVTSGRLHINAGSQVFAICRSSSSNILNCVV